MTLNDIQKLWRNSIESHKTITCLFTDEVNSDEVLNKHRTWVEQNHFGLGERAFHWLWLLLCNEMPKNFKFLEIGVAKGQVLSLIKLLRNDAYVFGVTPLDSTGGMWDSNYAEDIKKIHDEFGLPQPIIYKGLSEAKESIESAKNTAPYNICYVDGGHEKHHIDNDLQHYAPMVIKGGYLVVDDCCNDLPQEWGTFCGIDSVTDGVNEYMATHGTEWIFCFSIVHIKVFRKL